MKNKKCISPIIATGLLLVITIASIVAFQNWFNFFSDKLLLDTEEKSSNQLLETKIQTIINDKLYFDSKINNLTIKKIAIGDTDCQIEDKKLDKGINELTLRNCTNQIGKKLVTVNSNKGIFEKYINLETAVLSLKSYFLSILPSSNSDYGRSIIQNTNNEFIIVGDTTGFGNSDSDITLTKFNEKGQEIWTKIIDGTENDNGRDLILLSDGNIILTGNVKSFGNSDQDILISKFNNNGIEQWSKILDGPGHDYGYSITNSNDGGFAITGYTQSFGTPGVYDMFISKFNNNGVEQWTKTLGSNSNNDFGSSITKTNDNGYVITGFTQSYGGSDQDIIISKFNNNGIEQWTKILNSPNNDRSSNIICTSNNEYILTGNSKSYGGSNDDIIISKFNNSGQEQWTKVLSGPLSDASNSITPTSDGGFVIAGYTQSYGNSDFDIIISKFNNDGIEQWSKILNGTNHDYARSIIETDEKDLILTGRTQTFGNTDDDIIILKLDKNGTCQSCDKLLDLNLVEQNIDLTETNIDITESNTDITETNIDLTETDININEENIFLKN